MPRDAAARRRSRRTARASSRREHYIHTLGALNGIETVVLRYFNVFGPGQDPNSEYAAVVPKFVTAALDGRAPDDQRRRRRCRATSPTSTTSVEANMLAARVAVTVAA